MEFTAIHFSSHRVFICTGMMKNYFLVLGWNFRRNPGYSFLNLAGLSIGFAGTMLILSLVWTDITFDRFHTKRDRIFVTVQHRTGAEGSVELNGMSPPLLGPFLKSSIPEIESFARIGYLGRLLIKTDGQYVNEGGRYYADDSFFEIFDFPVIYGDRHRLFPNPTALFWNVQPPKNFSEKKIRSGNSLYGASRIIPAR